ncbi:MAG TPA: cytochrome c [Blastocatellia bacterium]|jgi:mono/diheme cytochrome c family protein
MCHRNNTAGRFPAAALIVIIIAATWMSGPARAQEKERRRNAEAQKLKNPVPSSNESIEAGRKLYQRHCAGCHGPQGKGDGSLALSGGTPSDLTDDAWDYGSSDGEIFVVIRDGVSNDMLAYKDKLTEKQVWELVNFIRNLGPGSKDDKR